MKNRSLVVSTLVLTLLMAATVLGQQGVSSGTVSGRVEDESSAFVAGVTVRITNTDRNQVQTAIADEQGRFRFLYLPVGAYELYVEQPGFAPSVKKFTLMVGQALDLPVRLSVATVAESVNVTDSAPTIELVRTQLSETIVPREIDSLPLNGRNYLDLALLSPGVSKTNTGSNERFAETSAVPGTGISVAGQRNLNNGFVMDGLSANDDAADLAGSFYSQEVIREFQVVTSGGIAEFGRASGGTINIVTQSGTNDWRGRMYGFLRNHRLDARNAFASGKDPLTQAQYGATGSGPLKKDRTFLFSNFERTQQQRSGFVTISPANVAAINQELSRVNYGGARIRNGSFSTGYDTANVFARVDHRFSDSNLLAVRYSFYDISSKNARGVGGLSDVSRGTSLANRDHNLAVNEVMTLTPTTINETRFQITRSRLSAPPNDLAGPAITISGVANLSTSTSSPVGRDIDLFELANNLSMQRGASATKVGVNVLRNSVDIAFPGALQGAYTFSSLANLQAGRYVNFQQAFGSPSQKQANPNVGVFVQNEWRARQSLTINTGLRYDVQWLPEPIQADTNNFSPRVGLAWAPGGGQKMVVRASYGLYFDRIPLRATSNALQRDGSKYKVAVLQFGQAGAPVFPNTLPAFPSNVLVSITTMDPRISSSYSQQANLQIERELMSGTSFSVGYMHLRGLHIIMSRNVNTPTLSAAEAAAMGIPNLGRPDPNWANISRYESAGDSYYDGMTLSFNNRATRWITNRLSYTLSKAIDNAGNAFFSSPQNSLDIRDDRGRGQNDQRHRLTFSGSLESRTQGRNLPGRVLGGFQLSYILSYSSALPFNIQTGADRNNDTNVNDRPAGVGRNTGEGFNSMTMDLRLSRRFAMNENTSLEVIAETFNTLNRTNFQFPNNIFGVGPTPLATFGRPTAANDPRQIQFGMRLSF